MVSRSCHASCAAAYSGLRPYQRVKPTRARTAQPGSRGEERYLCNLCVQ